MARSKKISVDRRGFLKGAAAGQPALPRRSRETRGRESARSGGSSSPRDSESAAGRQADRVETAPPPPHVDVYTTDRPGSDFMVDVIKSLGFEYVAANPGSSFRGLHESLINYGGNKNPELLTCCHEESSVAMAHGYAKIEGKPMLIMAHGTVGLQHASMAIYNAYADRVPVYILLGNIAGRDLAPQRRGMGPQRAGRRLHGPRLHQVGRRPGVARSTSPNPPCAPTRSP